MSKHLNFYYLNCFLLFKIVSSQPILDVTLDLAKRLHCDCVIVVNFEKNWNHKNVRNIAKSIMTAEVYDGSKSKIEGCSNPLFFLEKFQVLTETFLRDMKPARSVWLVNDQQKANINGMLENKTIALNTKILIADTSTVDSINIWRLSKLRLDGPPKFSFFASWRTAGGITEENVNTNCEQTALEGKSIRTAVFGVPPALYRPKKGLKDIYDGYYLRIHNIIADSLNIAHEVLDYKESAGVFVNGSWGGMIGRLIRGDFEMIAADLTMTTERLQVMEFGHTLLTSRYQIYMRPLSDKLEIGTPLKPLSVEIWLSLLLWIALASISFRFFNFVIFVCNVMELDAKYVEDMSLMSFALLVLQSLCQQGSEIVPKSCSYRLLFVSSFLLSSVLIPSYSASLVSTTTRKTTAYPFFSLEALMRTKYQLLSYEGTASYNFFSRSNLPLYQAIARERLISKTPRDPSSASYYGAFGDICFKDNLAAIVDENAMDAEYFSSGLWKNCDLVKMKEPLPKLHQAFGFPKGSRYVEAFNIKAILLTETGIISRLRKKYWPTLLPPSNANFHSVSLATVLPIIGILTLGLFFSLVILLAEFIKFNLD